MPIAHVRPLFTMLKILPFDLLITQIKGLLVHSILNKYSPIALHNTWQTNQERDPNYGLWDAHLLYIPFARTDHVKRLPFFSLPKLWNDLPDFKLSRNHITFKIALKEYLHELSSADPWTSQIVLLPWLYIPPSICASLLPFTTQLSSTGIPF